MGDVIPEFFQGADSWTELWSGASSTEGAEDEQKVPPHGALVYRIG
jgi:hypothetical protein